MTGTATWREVSTPTGMVDVLGRVAGGDDAVRAAAAADDWAALQGSFLLRLVRDQSQHWVTDRLGSISHYLDCRAPGTPVVRADPRPPGPVTLDHAAIASILVNGYPIGGRTPYAGITSLEAGSVTTLDQGAVRIHNYWQFQPRADPELAGRGRDQVRTLLGEALVRSVERHVEGPARLSLSAGYDARGILGILRHRLGRSDIATFSYAHGDPAPGSDAALAAQLSEEAGWPHTTIESVDPDLTHILADNARLGHGLTNFCDEVRVWTTGLNGDLPVIVGDECFGWNDVPLTAHRDVSESVYIFGGQALDGLRSILGRDVVGDIAQSLDELRETTLARHLPRDGQGDLHDAKDSIYFAERLRNGIMPWRERFAGAGREVLNPFLDGEVLDLVARLSPVERRGKALYREAIREVAPEAFTVPFATHGGYSPAWRQLFLADPGAVHQSLTDSSLLDVLVPPEDIARLAARIGSAGSRRREQASRVKASLWARPGLAHRVSARLPWVVDDVTLLRRLLVLRLALKSEPA